MEDSLWYLSGMEQLDGREKMLLHGCAPDLETLLLLGKTDVEHIIGRRLRNFTLDRSTVFRCTEHVLDARDRMELSCLGIWEDSYPILLRQICDPPFMLWCRGNPPSADVWNLAVVGTRRPSENGRQAAWQLGQDCAKHGVLLVSGLAYGIDCTSQAACVEAGGKTLAVMPGGVDIIAPQGNRQLAREILEQGGCLVSEYSPGVQPAPWRFLARNRIIAGLAPAVVVVECPRKSGALSTAAFALEEGRDVLVHPAGLGALTGEGTRALVMDGATLYSGMANLLEEYANCT